MRMSEEASRVDMPNAPRTAAQPSLYLICVLTSSSSSFSLAS